MTSFQWKRKAGGNIAKGVSKAFEENSKADTDDLFDSDIDWISLAPKRSRIVHLEDAYIKSNRLMQEGSTLAEAERFWEAIRKWDDALQLTPLNEKLYEMKSQALLMLNEIHPAVLAAQKCIELNSNWWIGHQTLGRALLALGEVRMALRSFSIALHLNPADEELWKDDFCWAFDLVRQKTLAELQLAREEEDGPKIVELDEDNKALVPFSSEHSSKHFPLCSQELVSSKTGKHLKSVPADYVIMRD